MPTLLLALQVLLLTVFDGVVGGLSRIDDACPSNFVSNVDNIYLETFNGTCFYFITTHIFDYPNAVKACDAIGGILAMPKTKDLNDFMRNKLVELNVKDPVWIGLHDRVEEGTYGWEDGTDLEWNNFVAWTDNSHEDCVVIHPWSGKWHDYRCQGYNFFSLTQDPRKPFICEIFPRSNETDSVNDEDKPTDDTTTATDNFYDNATDSFSNDNDDDDDYDNDSNSINKKDDCGPFTCNIDCFFSGGYKININGCQECACVDG